MRPLLILYVIVFLTLNFLVEGDLILLMAMSTFPVSLYLLLRKPRAKRRGNQRMVDPHEKIAASKEKSFEG